MRNKVAKQLRKEAESATVGEKPKETRRLYKRTKKFFKSLKTSGKVNFLKSFKLK